MRTRLIAPVVSAAAVVTLIVGVSVAVRGGDDPEPRRLSLAAAGAPESAAASGGGVASDSRSAGGSGVRLDATLPDEPDEARAYDLQGRSDEDTVRRLARALGIDAAPTRTDGRWVVENGERRLDVEP